MSCLEKFMYARVIDARGLSCAGPRGRDALIAWRPPRGPSFFGFEIPFGPRDTRPPSGPGARWGVLICAEVRSPSPLERWVRSLLFRVSFVSAQRYPRPTLSMKTRRVSPVGSPDHLASSMIVHGQRHVALEDDAPHGFREGVRSGMAGHHKHDVVNPSPTR